MTEQGQSLDQEGRSVDTKTQSFYTLAVYDAPTGSSLPQPPGPGSPRVETDMPTFLEHLLETNRSRGTTEYIGKRTPPAPTPIDTSPLRDYGTKVRLRNIQG